MPGTQKEKNTYPEVVVYTGDNCVWCERAKSYLAERGVPYTERNIEYDEEGQRRVQALSGQRHVPVITVGSDVVVGFQRRELAQILDSLLGIRTSE